jgi:acyl carrier protein
MTNPSEDASAIVREIVLRMAPEQSRIDAANPDLVNDLGYHSLALLEMAFALEDEFGLPPIDQERAADIHALADVEEYVLGELSAEHEAQS